MNKKVFNPKSKTHQATAITALVAAAIQFAPDIKELIEPEHYAIGMFVLSVIFHVLRNVTTTPIDQK